MDATPGSTRRELLTVTMGVSLSLRAWAATPVPLIGGGLAPGDSRRPMLTWIADQADIAWEAHPAPWLRAQKLILAGEGVMFGLTRTPSREKHLRFSLPIWSHHTWAVVRAGDDAHIRRYADLHDQPVCWARGSSYAESFTRAGLGHMIAHESSNDIRAVRMVAAGRCRAALVTLGTNDPERALRHQALQELRELQLVLVPRVMTSVMLHFTAGLSSRWHWVIDRIDRAIAAAPGVAEKMQRD
jgi:hypothetical protein